VLAHESGVANVADPLGGSWFVESLTDEVERQAEEIFAKLDAWGEGSILRGVVHGIEENWFQGEIAEAAYVFQRKVASGRRLVVGVNAFTEGSDEPAPPTLQIGPEVDEAQRKRLAAVRQARPPEAVEHALGAVAAVAAEPTANLVPPILDAVRAYATVGEIVGALASVFGRWAEHPVL
jgi:methylmalonyl-CoA mutase N-terminal domain/subunit